MENPGSREFVTDIDQMFNSHTPERIEESFALPLTDDIVES